MKITEILPENIISVYKLLQELRPHISEPQFAAIYQAARKADQYSLYGYYQGKECLGLLGVRFLTDFVHGFHLYIDDLVVKEADRSRGVGAALLQFAETVAKEKGCTGLRLCTGVDNKAGMRFYEREKWQSRAVVYKKKVYID